MAIIEVKNLTKTYGERRAVDDVSFSVEQGEIFGFLGANGAGKSTTLKMLCGLANITSGNVKICGYSIKHNFEKAISCVGAIIEYPQFYEYLSGLSNLKFFAKINNISKNRIFEVANLVGLSARLNDKVKKYSLGMKQRLGIAQALLCNPKVLILDEPTNGLDANAIRELRILFKNISRSNNVAIIISSHIIPEMEQICDKIAIINNGKIIDCNTISEIRKKTLENGNLYIKVNTPDYAGMLIKKEFNINAKILGKKVLINTDETQLAKIIMLLTNKHILIYGAGEVDINLEEIFVNVINKNGGKTIK